MNGFVEGLGNIEDICFHAKDFKSDAVTPPKVLAVSSYQHSVNEPPWSCLWCVQAPPLDYDPTVTELKREACPVYCTKTQQQDLNDKVTAVASASKKSVVVGYASGNIRMFAVPTNASPPAAKSPTTAPLDNFPAHDQLVSRLSVSKDGVHLISAAMDGQIRASAMEGSEKGRGLKKLLHNPYNGGVVQVCTDKDTSVFLSTGGADGILVWANQGTAFHLARQMADDEEEDEDEYGRDRSSGIVDDKDTAAYPVWVPSTG